MAFQSLPRSAAWRHREAREGFEVVFTHVDPAGCRHEGGTAAVEAAEAWLVAYVIVVGATRLTREAIVSGRSSSGRSEVRLEADGAGRWRVNGHGAPHLDGCFDVDLESSALTNALPVRRLGLAVGAEADAPAAYVRAGDLTVERLDEHYVRLEDVDGRERYHYAAPALDFECELLYDAFGLVIDYPGLATRVS